MFKLTIKFDATSGQHLQCLPFSILCLYISTECWTQEREEAEQEKGICFQYSPHGTSAAVSRPMLSNAKMEPNWNFQLEHFYDEEFK